MGRCCPYCVLEISHDAGVDAARRAVDEAVWCMREFRANIFITNMKVCAFGYIAQERGTEQEVWDLFVQLNARQPPFDVWVPRAESAVAQAAAKSLPARPLRLDRALYPPLTPDQVRNRPWLQEPCPASASGSGSQNQISTTAAPGSTDPTSTTSVGPGAYIGEATQSADDAPDRSDEGVDVDSDSSRD